MNELKTLTLLNTPVARACAQEYILFGRDAALAWLRGYWYGTGVREYATTVEVAAVFGLEVRDGALSTLTAAGAR